jgi:hypothetical protein
MVSGWVRAWHRYQLRQLSEVLGGCCEKELIARAILIALTIDMPSPEVPR